METTINTGGAGGTTVIPDINAAGGPSGPQVGGGTAAAGVTPPAATSTPSWTDTLAPALKEYVTQKGFKDPGALTDSYRNLETLMGAPKERLVKLPENMSDPKSMGEVYDRLGRPKASTEYSWKVPEGTQANPEFTKFAQDLFYEAGLSKSQGEQVASKWNEFAAGVQKQTTEQQIANLTTEKAALGKEWGAATEQNIKMCAKAAQSFGLGKEELTKMESALGYSNTMKFLQKIGAKVGEDSFVGGEQKGFEGALTPDRAKAQIEELKADKSWVEKYTTGDAEAKQKMSRLMSFAYPDTDATAFF